MTTDFTKGSPAKHIFLFTLPYLIGNLFQQFYNIVDTVIVGRFLGPEALAAVGSTGGLVWFANGAIVSLTTGFSAVIAQYFGANLNDKMKSSFGMSIGLSAVISISLSTVCSIFAMPILRILKTPEEIIEMSYGYIIWIFMGLVASALFNLLSNAIRALGDSKTPLLFLVIACFINIVLDIVFITAFKMGPAGAGLATVIAQLISGLLCIVYIIRKQPLLHITAENLRLDMSLVYQLLHIGVPMALLNMLLSLGTIVMQFVNNMLGTVFIASQTAAAKVEQFVTQPLLSLGSATAVFIAQNKGAKRYDRIIEGSKKANLMGLGWCVIITVIMLLFGRFFLGLIVGDEPEVIAHGYLYIVINTVFCFIVSLVIIIKNILQTLGHAFIPIFSGVLEILGRAGAALGAFALFSVESLQFRGICFANPLAWLFGLIPLIIDYAITMKKLRKMQ